MTDGEKLAKILYWAKRPLGGAINVEGGFAYDRVMRKAVLDGLVTIGRKQNKSNYSYTTFKITAKGRKKLKYFENKGAYKKEKEKEILDAAFVLRMKHYNEK